MKWHKISETPPPPGRLLVCRNIGGNIYVDILAYFLDDPAGLPPLPTLQNVTHWAHVPPPPDDAGEELVPQ